MHVSLHESMVSSGMAIGSLDSGYSSSGLFEESYGMDSVYVKRCLVEGYKDIAVLIGRANATMMGTLKAFIIAICASESRSRLMSCMLFKCHTCCSWTTAQLKVQGRKMCTGVQL